MKSSLRELDLREFGDWPLMHRAAACLLLALLALGLPWGLLTRPTSAQWQGLKSAEHELQTRLLHARQRVDALPALSPLLPDEPVQPVNLPALITTIAETAQAAGLHDGQFRQTSPPAIDTSADGIPIELRLHGTWPQLAGFARDLAAPTSDAILSLRDIRLRAQPAASSPMLELSATIWIYPRPNVHSIPVLASQAGGDFRRNPFIDSMTRLRQTSSYTVIGSLGHGQGQVGLMLTADGELRRVRGTTR